MQVMPGSTLMEGPVWPYAAETEWFPGTGTLTWEEIGDRIRYFERLIFSFTIQKENLWRYV